MPRFSIEGALGIAAGIILFVLDKMGIGGTLIYILLFFIAAVLCIDSVARSDWADSGKRRLGAGGAVLVFYLLFGLWIFARPHKSEHATGEQKAADSKDHGQSAETNKSASTERGSDEPKSPPSKPERRSKSGVAAENALVPPQHGAEQFLTYVVLYSDNSVVCMMNTNLLRNGSCGDVRDAFKAHLGEDHISSLAVILQHYMVPLIYAAGTGWGIRGGGVDGRFAENQIAPIEPPESVNYVASRLVDVSPAKKSDLYPFWFVFPSNEPKMKLPKETKLYFLKKEVSQERPESYIARLERKGYYQMDFSVCRYAAPRRGEIPEKYTVPDWLNVSQATTYSFVVRVDWTLDRSHAASFAVEDYDNWAKQLSGSIRDKLQN